MKAGNTDRSTILSSISKSQAFSVELFPPVLIVGERRICFFFRHFRLSGLHVVVNTDRRGEKIARNSCGCRRTYLFMLISTLLRMILLRCMRISPPDDDFRPRVALDLDRPVDLLDQVADDLKPQSPLLAHVESLRHPHPVVFHGQLIPIAVRRPHPD